MLKITESSLTGSGTFITSLKTVTTVKDMDAARTYVEEFGRKVEGEVTFEEDVNFPGSADAAVVTATTIVLFAIDPVPTVGTGTAHHRGGSQLLPHPRLNPRY